MYFLMRFAILCFIIAVPELRAALALIGRAVAATIPANQVREMDSPSLLPAIDHLPPLRQAQPALCHRLHLRQRWHAEASGLGSGGRERIGMRVSIVRGEETLRPGLSSTRRPG